MIGVNLGDNIGIIKDITYLRAFKRNRITFTSNNTSQNHSTLQTMLNNFTNIKWYWDRNRWNKAVSFCKDVRAIKLQLRHNNIACNTILWNEAIGGFE